MKDFIEMQQKQGNKHAEMQMYCAMGCYKIRSNYGPSLDGKSILIFKKKSQRMRDLSSINWVFQIIRHSPTVNDTYQRF